MSQEGYKKDGRIFEGENPYILLCPQCNDTLECTSDGRCYCFGCDVAWKKSEVKEMCRFYGDEGAVPFKEPDC